MGCDKIGTRRLLSLQQTARDLQSAHLLSSNGASSDLWTNGTRFSSISVYFIIYDVQSPAGRIAP